MFQINSLRVYFLINHNTCKTKNKSFSKLKINKNKNIKNIQKIQKNNKIMLNI